MSTAFFETTESRDTSREWLPNWERNRSMLYELFRSAAERALHTGHSIVASATWVIPDYDLVNVFAAARTIADGSSFYWEQPVQSTTFVGMGAAATLTATGDSSIADVASQWRALLHNAVIATAPDVSSTMQTGPLCFCGFAFDPVAPHTPLWEGFPDGLLVLPELLISSSSCGTALTANLVITPNEAALEQRIDMLERRVMRACSAIKRQESEHGTGTATFDIQLHNLWPAPEWMSLVGEVSHDIRAGTYQKVVLARGVEAKAEKPFDVCHALFRLRSAYPAASIFAIQRGARCFLGATPERLARVEDGRVHTMALAGSAPRGDTDAGDLMLAETLLRSEKDRREHAIVVKAVCNGMAPLVSTLDVPQKPYILRLANVQHLQTPITGTLLQGKTILDMTAALHPTPAVGGFPRDTALAIIRECEHLDRGWYASPIGWVGASGDGEFAVALRSALVEGDRATLFAGCGIVADSEPLREYEETCLKLRVMLDALHGES